MKAVRDRFRGTATAVASSRASSRACSRLSVLPAASAAVASVPAACIAWSRPEATRCSSLSSRGGRCSASRAAAAAPKSRSAGTVFPLAAAATASHSIASTKPSDPPTRRSAVALPRTARSPASTSPASKARCPLSLAITAKRESIAQFGVKLSAGIKKVLRLLRIPREPVRDADLGGDARRPSGIAEGTPKGHRFLKQFKCAFVLALLPGDHAQDSQCGGHAAAISAFARDLRASSPNCSPHRRQAG